MRIAFTLQLLFCFLLSSAQDSSLLKMLSDSMNVHAVKEYTAATFKGTNVINLQTVEQPGKNVLQFIIMHRFGKLNDGSYNFFGLDNAVLRMGLSYGLTSNLAITIGRSSLDKALDASIKYKLLRQTTNGKTPVSISFYSSFVYPTIKYSDKPFYLSKYRPIYTNQIILARKMNEKLSVILSPTYIHFNIVEKQKDHNDVYVLGMGARYKISKRMSINAEYDYLPNGQINTAGRTNSFSLGLDIETGGHVFQLVFTNSQGMVEPYYMAKTTGSWSNGDIYFGFNISRVFNIHKK